MDRLNSLVSFKHQPEHCQLDVKFMKELIDKGHAVKVPNSGQLDNSAANYLTNLLQPRSKWNKPCQNLAVGDVVMIVDEALPRSQWKLGRVVTADPGTDGLVRKVKIKIGNPGFSKGKYTAPRFLERPVQKLVLLLKA